MTTINRIKLLPCPHYGHNDNLVLSETNVYYVECVICGDYGPGAETEQAAIEAWNKRTEQDANDVVLMKKALLSVEWINPLSSVEYSPEHDWCPWCHRELKIGHSKNCPRQIALGISYESPASDSMRKLAEKVVEWEKQNPARTIPDLAADDLAASVAGVADIPARREEDDLNKLDEA